MSDLKFRISGNYNHDVKNYAKGTPVTITKGFLKGCKGKISGCTSERVYFVGIDSCKRDKSTYNPINLYLPNEFEVSN